MKINIQKAVKCLSVLLAVVAITLTAFAPPAHAAGWMPVIYDPWEYEISSDVDGDYRIVKFAIPVKNPITMAWLYADGQDAGSKKLPGPSNGFDWGSDVDRFVIRTFYLGGGVSWINSAVNGSVLSVKDLKQGSTFCLTGTYGVDLTLSSAPGTLSAHAMLFVYDSEGNWITSYTGQEYTYDVPVGTHNFGYSLTFKNYLPKNAAYIVPYLQILFEYDDSVITATGGSIGVYYPDDWTFEVPINMVLENTQTMHAIKDKLDDIDDALGDLNDKQDQTNDKLDNIISGGEAGDNLNDALSPSSPFGDASDDLNDAVGDFEDSSSKLPTVPDKIPGTDSALPTLPDPIDPGKLPGIPNSRPDTPETPTEANPDSVDDYVNMAGNFLDWENSGLTYMYAPMVLSVTLAIVFYTVFGKA